MDLEYVSIIFLVKYKSVVVWTLTVWQKPIKNPIQIEVMTKRKSDELISRQSSPQSIQNPFKSGCHVSHTIMNMNPKGSFTSSFMNNSQLRPLST